MQAVEALEQWIETKDTYPNLADATVEYVRGLDLQTMKEIFKDTPTDFSRLGWAKDTLGGVSFWKG
jgi:hypothetical protein